MKYLPISPELFAKNHSGEHSAAQEYKMNDTAVGGYKFFLLVTFIMSVANLKT